MFIDGFYLLLCYYPKESNLFSLEFNQKLENEKMTDLQRTTARDVRRRGKNKVGKFVHKKCLFTLELIIITPRKN